MTTTQTPPPTGGESTSTAGVIVTCAHCHAVIVILANGSSAVKGSRFVCGRCGSLRTWAKRRR